MSNQYQSGSSSYLNNIKGGNNFKNDSKTVLNYKLNKLLKLEQKGGKKNKKQIGGLPEKYFNPNLENFDPNQVNEFNNKISLLGGNSAFIPTITSRGPVNYPSSQGTNMSGEQLFKIFNKTGTYIANEDLNKASVLKDGILGYKLAGGNKY